MAAGPRRALKLLVCLVVALGGTSCLTHNESSRSTETDTRRVDALQTLMDDVVRSDRSVPGILLAVRSPALRWSGVSGAAAINGRPLQSGDLFRAASVTKTLVSAALFRLAESGTIDLDQPISLSLSDDSVLALQRGGYDPTQISVAQLLNHTAGLFDYTEAPSFYAIIEQDPAHAWTRQEQLDLAMDEGQPLNAPGQAYHYGDTHYILAGEILERRMGMSLDAALRSVLHFDELGMVDTFVESSDAVAPPDASARMTHPYRLKEDTLAWNASWDLFGGGGIVTTVDDLMRFYTALFDTSGAGVFSQKDTLDRMLAMPEQGRGAYFGIDGGSGINRFLLDDGVACYGAFGYFSTMLVHCPAAGIQFAATQNQSDPLQPDAILDGVVEILRE
jgi:D-alanyl-D-alanine carboxypeptidase